MRKRTTRFHTRRTIVNFLIVALTGLAITAPLGLQKVTGTAAPMEY